MKKRFVLFLLPLLLISMFVSGCDSNNSDSPTSFDFSLNVESKTMKIDTDFQIVPIFNVKNIKKEYQKLTWTSSRKSYVSVDDNGLLHALKLTSTPVTITATSEITQKSVKCSIYVVNELIVPTSISLSENEMYLEPCKSKKLSISYEPSSSTVKDVTWISSEPAVVGIENNTITINENATDQDVVVTAISNGNSNVFDTCLVHIAHSIVHVTSFNLNYSETTMIIEDTLQLTANFYPANAIDIEKKVSWISSNNKILTVDENGLVTAKSIGSAQIVAKSMTLGTICKCDITVEEKPIYPTSISLTEKDISLMIGRNHQFEVIYTPNDCNAGKGVVWTSSNESVGTISESGMFVINPNAKAGQVTKISVKSTYNPSFTSECIVTITEEYKAKWTIIFYICGADLESQNSLATSDIKEILSVDRQPDDVNILIQTGGAKSWNSKYGISASYTGRYHVENKSLVLDEQLPKANFGSSNTLQECLEWGINKYPAEKTGLILWNHGGGMDGVCYDENYRDDCLYHNEIKVALEEAFENTGRSSQDKLEFIGYDACLMALQDSEEYISQFCNYFVSSQEVESGYGWDYDTWLDDLYAKKPTLDILKAIVDGFIKDNDKYYSNDQTLSVINSNAFESYRNAFETYAEQLNNKLTDYKISRDTFTKFVSQNIKSYAGEDAYYFASLDVADFISQVETNSLFSVGGNYASDVMDAFKNLVVYENHGKAAGNSNGLNLFFPWSNNTCGYRTTNFTKWKSLCKTFGYA